MCFHCRFTVFYIVCGCLIFVCLILFIYFFIGGWFKKIKIVGTYWSCSYECGFLSRSVILNYFRFTYFSLLVFFVIFDLEISLLLNMCTQGILFDKYYYYYIFILILFLGYLGEVLIGYVGWNY